MIYVENGPLDEFESAVLVRVLSEARVAGEEIQSDHSCYAVASTDVVPGLRSWRPRTPALVAAAVCAAAAVVLGMVFGFSHNSATAAPPSPPVLAFKAGAPGSGVEPLTEAASAVAHGASPSESVLYVETTTWAISSAVRSKTTTSFFRSDVRQIWRDASGVVEVRDWTQDLNAQGLPVGDLGPSATPNVNGTYLPGQWPFGTDNLPLTISGLQKALSPSDVTGPNPESYLQAAEDLVSGTASSQLEAALYRFIATAPGVFYAGQLVDTNGRVAEAVGFDGPLLSSTEYLLFNPTTGAPFEWEEVVPGSTLGLKNSDSYVNEYTVLDTSRNVSSLGSSS